MPPATTSTLGGVIVDGTTIKVDGSGKISAISSGDNAASLIVYTKEPNNDGIGEMWEANIDGTNQHKLNISFPNGYTLMDDAEPKISEDKQKIFFMASNNNNLSLFSCSIDGSNVTHILDGAHGTFDIK